MREALLSMLNAARGVAATLGLRTITVALRTETSAPGAFGTTGSTTTSVDVALDPQPKVRRIGDAESFHEGDTELSRATGGGRIGIYRIGPITPRALAGTGYDLAHLLPQNSTPSRRCCLALSGQEIGATPLAFELVEDGFEQTALHLYLTVRQAQAL